MIRSDCWRCGFIPTAEFYQSTTQMQVAGAYLNLPGVDVPSLSVSITGPAEGSKVSGIVPITANPVGTVTVDQVEFFVNGASIGVDVDGSDGWSIAWNTTTGPDGQYGLTAVASGGGLVATSAARRVTVALHDKREWLLHDHAQRDPEEDRLGNVDAYGQRQDGDHLEALMAE